MEATINEFYTKLKQVPAFLLLGRHYLGLETGTDPFLAEILWKYGRRGEEKTSYYDMLDGDATHFVDAALAWNDRRHVAVALARRLPEAVTPLGVLAIAGYTGDLDWLSLADLLPIVNRLNPRQTHIFSVTQALREHPNVKYLAAQEKLILHHESLATTLSRGEDLGFLRLSPPLEEETSGQHIRFGDKVSVHSSIRKDQRCRGERRHISLMLPRHRLR